MDKIINEIRAERVRQIEVEGWTAQHDDMVNAKGELAQVAACYTLHTVPFMRNSRHSLLEKIEAVFGSLWPWDPCWWKRTCPRRDLIKAAALLVAEIERLDRAALRAAAEGEGS